MMPPPSALKRGLQVILTALFFLALGLIMAGFGPEGWSL